MDLSKIEKIWNQYLLCDCKKHTTIHSLERKKLYDNFKIEERIDSDISEIYINEIAKFSASPNCLEIINSIYHAQKECKKIILNGHEAKTIDDKICFLKSSKAYHLFDESFTDQVDSILDDPMGPPLSDIIKKKFDLGLITTSMLKDNISNSLGINWSTNFDNIKNDLDNNIDIDKIRDKLGLDVMSMYGQDDYAFLIVYNSSKVKKKFICPTVLHAGSFHAFQPSKNGSVTGFTIDLSTGEKGYPEFVHKGIDDSKNSVIDIIKIGKLTKDPSIFYLESKYASK